MIYSVTTRRGRRLFEFWWDSTSDERGITVHRLRDGLAEDTHFSVASAWEHLGTTWVHEVDGKLIPYDCTGDAAEIPADMLDGPGGKLLLALRKPEDMALGVRVEEDLQVDDELENEGERYEPEGFREEPPEDEAELDEP